MHLNQETIESKVNELYEGKLELMDIKAALKKYPWLEEYRWKLVSKDKDEYTKKVAEDYSGGYFMRIIKGAEIAFPTAIMHAYHSKTTLNNGCTTSSSPKKTPKPT